MRSAIPRTMTTVTSPSSIWISRGASGLMRLLWTAYLQESVLEQMQRPTPVAFEVERGIDVWRIPTERVWRKN